MRITDKAIKAIKETKRVRRELIYHLDISHMTLYRWLEANEEDGNLTKANALKIISENTGLSSKQILTEKITA